MVGKHNLLSFVNTTNIDNSKTARILEYCNQLAIPIYFFYSIKGMNKTNIHNQKQKQQNLVASIAIVVALTLFVSPMLNVDDALATHNKKNKAKQSIDQSQSSNQNAWMCIWWNNLSLMQ